MPTSTDLGALCSSFDSQASTYARRMGHSTTRVATHAITLLSPLPDYPLTVLDNACGPGYASIEFLKAHPTAHIYATDVAPSMISLLETQIAEDNYQDHISTAVMDGASLGYADNTFDVSITNFGLFFLPEPVVGAREIYRTLKPGGKAIVTCWKRVPYLPILHAVQALLRPDKEEPPIVMSVLNDWTRPETMEEFLREGGFSDGKGEVKIAEKEVMWWNKGREEAAKGFSDNFVNMVGDRWSEEEKKKGILNATIRVLKERGPEFVIEGEGEMIGFRMAAWIAVAVKKP